jgi:hypothetical protein
MVVSQKKVKPGPDSLAGNNIAWAKLVLVLYGIDATVADANRWLPWKSGDPGAGEINKEHMEEARRQLQGTNKRKRFFTKLDRFAVQLDDFIKTPEGLKLIRERLRGQQKLSRRR